jgi:lipopolysaccharide/colanic/teichoic acid biosynthesis glycosyltransferase
MNHPSTAKTTSNDDMQGGQNWPKSSGGCPQKRLFDCIITLLAAPLWLPVLAICAALILLLEGRPVFYVSRRQIGLGLVHPILKFRTMVRNADKILNRETVPVVGTRFLNIPGNSPVYTPIGRAIERLALTELPQLLRVVSGDMSLVGSRPLPVGVMNALRTKYAYADSRFLTKAGLTGPVQLVGRDTISDADRLAIEIEYCRIAASERYRMRLDLWLLIYTVLVVAIPGQLLTVAQVREKMYRLAKPRFRRAVAIAPLWWMVASWEAFHSVLSGSRDPV